MVRLRINNIDFEVPEGKTILEVARGAGINIPTMCHSDDLPHYSSCFVCIVKNNKTDSYIPSCSALVQNGLDISTSGDDVFEMRKKAIELLLSEHRAECEAPCKVVCPVGHDIPLMNRLLSSGNFDAATKLSFSELKSELIHCIDCSGYCENACRRKKIDKPVSIRNTQLFVFRNISEDKRKQLPINVQDSIIAESAASNKSNKTDRPFVSHTGIVTKDELTEWLKECPETTERFREINDFRTAGLEAENCMHCDCRAKDNCSLRDLAKEYQVKDPRGKLVNAPIAKKINYQTGLIFENAKCIKCGLCIRLCEDDTSEIPLCFLNRGFISILSEPLTEDFSNVLRNKSEDCIEICPTGALGRLK